MTGHLEKTVLDCQDPRTLAAFYAAVLGMRVNEDHDDRVVIGSRPGAVHYRGLRACPGTVVRYRSR